MTEVCWNPILLPWRNTSIVMFGSILVGITYLEHSSRFGKWRVCAHCRKREQSFVHCSGEERMFSPVNRGLHNPDHFCVEDVYWHSERGENTRELFHRLSSKILPFFCFTHPQLLDEVSDFGIPVITEPSIMSSIIKIPTVINKVSALVTKVAVIISLLLSNLRTSTRKTPGSPAAPTTPSAGAAPTCPTCATRSASASSNSSMRR